MVRIAGSPLGARRRALGWTLAAAGPVLLALALPRDALATDLLLFLALTVVVALAGGLWPAVAAAVLGFLLANWFLTPPLHTLTIGRPANLVGLLVFVAVAVAVSSVVDLAARRTRQAARAGAEAATLAMLATTVLRGENALPALLERVRDTFDVRAVALLVPDGDGWTVAGAAGEDPAAAPEEAGTTARAGRGAVLALSGPVRGAAGRRVLAAFAARAEDVLEWRRLAEEADRVRRLEEGDRVRTALLAAVSHDLRTPLATIKAAVSGLRAGDVAFDPADEAELLASAEESADRLDGLIGNLLDMSRLRTGVVTPQLAPVDLLDVLPAALAGVPRGTVAVDVPADLPPVLADAGLLERALANVAENAVRHNGGAAPVELAAAAAPGGRVAITVADHGPGVPAADRAAMFAPFQRLGDVPRGDGVGLGLAVARGLTEAMGGALTAAATPGGGLTMVFELPGGAP
ncbi:sensor histidine kinase [Actinomadura parmotrematis]|uniref:histidine kinase n=1 Tax=Actinomadura parmotrematis TaxID=2864039 RepID=A0ABS7FPB6_9ACTN|nr:DUF4118 domain-containing protein [Actinomadura parmotrematis]MBW8482212.1 DUF4118 domain-containing protein [Actinomadura parmotrematis]